MAVDQVTLNVFAKEQGTSSLAIVSSATPAVNTDYYGYVNISALAVAITSMTSGLTGTPNDGQLLVFRILDNGTPRAITWGASFVDYRGAGSPALLTTTVAGKRHTVTFRYDAAAAKWGMTALAQE